MKVVALSGGVGGVKLVDGLAEVLAPDALTVVVNTGDDLRHWGLWVSPDVDTVMYTLARLSDDERGWGVKDESFRALDAMKRYGAPSWFSLGDRDLGTHLVRTEALARGETLTAVTARLCEALGVKTRILPMADAPCPTMIATVEHGTVPFQDWLVGLRGPVVERVFSAADPPPAPGVVEAIEQAEVVIIGPSNPYVSIDPILTRPGVREAMAKKCVIAVSPIVGGKAIKGPLAEMIPALAQRPPSASAVAAHYAERYPRLLRAFVVESGDEAFFEGAETRDRSLRVHAAQTVMRDRDARVRLARDVLALAETLG